MLTRATLTEFIFNCIVITLVEIVSYLVRITLLEICKIAKIILKRIFGDFTQHLALYYATPQKEIIRSTAILTFVVFIVVVVVINRKITSFIPILLKEVKFRHGSLSLRLQCTVRYLSLGSIKEGRSLTLFIGVRIIKFRHIH